MNARLYVAGLFNYAPRPPSPPPPPGTPPPFYAVSTLFFSYTHHARRLTHTFSAHRTRKHASRCLASPTLASTSASTPSRAPPWRSARAASLCAASPRSVGAPRPASRAWPRPTRRMNRATQTTNPLHNHKRCTRFPSRPPPPAFNVTETSGAGSLRAQRARLGDLERYDEPRRTDTAQWSFDKSGAIDGTKALIDSLGETNPVLKSLLDTAMDEIQAAGGRRLMQRIEYETYMTDVLVTHELMEFYGKGSEIEPMYLNLVLTHCTIAFQARVGFLA